MQKIFIFSVFYFMFFGFVCADYPDIPPTDYVFVNGSIEKIELKDGIDLSNKDLRHCKINRLDEELKNINFDNSDLRYSFLDETTFVNCSFRNANLEGVDLSSEDCDFTDAKITGSSLGMTREKLISTHSYKNDELQGIWFGNVEGVNLMGKNLRRCHFYRSMIGCSIEDAFIRGAEFSGHHLVRQYVSTLTDDEHKVQYVYEPGVSLKQLQSTYDFKSGLVVDCRFESIDFTDADFSRMNFIGCSFWHHEDHDQPYQPPCNFRNVNLADTVITNCNFRSVENLTKEQIESTWNYKNNRLENVVLPKYLLKYFPNSLSNSKGKKYK
jgi:uncharacterized protein YjbI with pentapeptide repeats